MGLSGSGTIAVVGAPGAVGGKGAAYSFTSSGGWSEKQVLGAGAGGFGASVAVSTDGSTALVGAPYWNAGQGTGYLFTNPGSGTFQLQQQFINPPTMGFRAGFSAALSSNGNTALLGTGSNGAWVYTRSNNSWNQNGTFLPVTAGSQATWGGWSVALSGDGMTALLGSILVPSGVGPAGFQATVYSRVPAPTGPPLVRRIFQYPTIRVFGPGAPLHCRVTDKRAY